VYLKRPWSHTIELHHVRGGGPQGVRRACLDGGVPGRPRQLPPGGANYQTRPALAFQQVPSARGHQLGDRGSDGVHGSRQSRRPPRPSATSIRQDLHTRSAYERLLWRMLFLPVPSRTRQSAPARPGPRTPGSTAQSRRSVCLSSSSAVTLNRATVTGRGPIRHFSSRRLRRRYAGPGTLGAGHRATGPQRLGPPSSPSLTLRFKVS
jgi:hypothetical protein